MTNDEWLAAAKELASEAAKMAVEAAVDHSFPGVLDFLNADIPKKEN